MTCVEKSDRKDLSYTDSSIVLLPSFQKAIFIVLKQLQTALIVIYSDIQIINLKYCLVCHNDNSRFFFIGPVSIVKLILKSDTLYHAWRLNQNGPLIS